jgi:hypothetical protein
VVTDAEFELQLPCPAAVTAATRNTWATEGVRPVYV